VCNPLKQLITTIFMKIRPSHVLIVGAMSIFALTGCNKTETTQSSPGESSASPVATATTSSSSASPAGYPGLLAVVTSTKASVEAGNFAQAKTDFGKFEDNWKPIEDGFKAKSKDSYSAIEDSSDQVKNELKGSQPNKAKLLAALQTMETSINKASKP
jgi:hypothetical protein